jgi:hypothetical protein
MLPIQQQIKIQLIYNNNSKNFLLICKHYRNIKFYKNLIKTLYKIAKLNKLFNNY